MSEEEKEAIEILKDKDVLWNNSEKKVIANIDIVLNLIDKQQKEIEEYKKKIKEKIKELQKNVPELQTSTTLVNNIEKIQLLKELLGGENE